MCEVICHNDLILLLTTTGGAVNHKSSHTRHITIPSRSFNFSLEPSTSPHTTMGHATRRRHAPACAASPRCWDGSSSRILCIHTYTHLSANILENDTSDAVAESYRWSPGNWAAGSPPLRTHRTRRRRSAPRTPPQPLETLGWFTQTRCWWVTNLGGPCRGLIHRRGLEPRRWCCETGAGDSPSFRSAFASVRSLFMCVKQVTCGTPLNSRQLNEAPPLLSPPVTLTSSPPVDSSSSTGAAQVKHCSPAAWYYAHK